MTAAFFALLLAESWRARRARRALTHVVHVNGTRGKSSVTRLIDAGLRAGGYQVLSKTTGTLPMVIGVDGEERLIRRRGKANIKEQLWVLGLAARQGAQVLVAECMAVDPKYQKISQHRMLRADIGVITNVRLDHTDVMGETLEEIAQALCSTVPHGGALFTAEQACYAQMSEQARKMGAACYRSASDGSLYDLENHVLQGPQLDLSQLDDVDLPENIALALAVCTHLGVDRTAALAGMRHYKRDPFALSLHRVGNGALFIGALSANDPLSSQMLYRHVSERLQLADKRLILLISNRPDRISRTAQMAELAGALQPDEIWLLGAGQRLLERKLRPLGIPVKRHGSAAEVDLAEMNENTVIFAAGNVAGQGRALMERVREEGSLYDLQ